MFLNRIANIARAAALAICLAPAAQAATVNMSGQTVTVEYLFPTVSTSYTGFSSLPATFNVTNNASDRITAKIGNTRYFTIDVNNSNITLSFLQNLTFTVATFSGLRISGLAETLDGVSVSGAPTATVSFTDHAILINLAGLTVTKGDTLVVTPDGVIVAAVPLPAPIWLFAGGLALLFALGRRRRNAGPEVLCH